MTGTIRRGKLVRADLAHWDGRTATYTRTDATGGTLTGLVIGNEVDVLQVYGSGANRTRASIANAITQIGSNVATLVFAPGVWTIDDDLTIPANLPCHIPAGCVFSVSSGKTITFSGQCLVEYPIVWTSGAGTVVAQESVHGAVWLRTDAERDEGIIPTSFFYPPLNVRRYGALLDGTTDDTTAFNSAITVAYTAGGGVVTFDGNTRVLNLSQKDKVSIQGIGNPIMNLVASGSTDVAISAVGTLGTAINLSANAAQAAESVSVASASGLAEGDYVLIREDTYVATTVGRKQEINRVIDITGGAIALANRLLEPYTTAAAAQIIKLNALSQFKWSGFQIRVAPGATLGGGVNMQYCADFSISDVTITGTYSAAAIKTTTCAFGIIASNVIRDTQGGVPGGSNGLGLYITEGTHHLVISGNIFSNYAQNSIETRSRHIQFIGNNCRSSKDVAINTHGNGVADCLIADNVIDGCGTHGISVGFSSHVAGDTRITVRGNQIKNVNKHGISVAGATAKTNTHIVIEDNDIMAYKLDSPDAAAGVFLSYGDDCEVRNNRINGATVGDDPESGVRLDNCLRARAMGNRVKTIVNGYGVQITSCTDFVVEGNRFKDISSNNIISTSSAGTNYVRNNVADDSTVDIDAAYRIDNSFDNVPGSSSDRGDNSVTLVVGTDAMLQRFDTSIGTNRTVTLSPTNVYNGARFRIVRTAAGAGTLDVGGLKTIPAATPAFVDAEHNGTAWKFAGYGTL